MQLLRGLIHGQKAYTGPFFAEIDVTNRCNLSCLGCPYHSSRTSGLSAGVHGEKNLPLELVQRFAKELAVLGTSEAIITGEGEPFLHPRLFEIIRTLKQAGLRTQIFTNGTLLDAAHASALLDSGPDLLKVSLWASSAEEYLLCYPGAKPDTFSKIIEGIRTLTALKRQRNLKKPRVVLTGPINIHNHLTIDKKIVLAHELGCDGLAFAPYKHWRGEFSSVVLSAADIHTLRKNLVPMKKLCHSLSLDHNIDDLLFQYALGESSWSGIPCSAGWYATRLRFDGTMTPCCRCNLVMGNLNDQSFHEIWNHDNYRAFRVRAGDRDGLISLGESCDCNWCAMAKNNHQVHRLSRGILALSGRK